MNISVVPILNDESLVSNVIDSLYGKMLDDYRINRFFFTRPMAEQCTALKTFINAVLNNSQTNNNIPELLDAYFTIAFARTNAKPSLVNNRDFAFLLDIVGGKDIRPINLLCPAHSFLMKLLPDDEHYDVVMELLLVSLRELNISGSLADSIVAFAESGRDSLLGRGSELMKAA